MNHRHDPLRLSDEEFLLLRQRHRRPAAGAETARRKPRNLVPLAVFLAIATIVSTFWSGICAWVPYVPLEQAWFHGTALPIRQVILANWVGGLQFSLALMAILVAHELGHYLMTIYYGVPSTPPLFIPFPLISPIGTMGAVIMMQSGTANRRQIFDIGLAGPLAGLVVAVPIIIWGVLDGHPLPRIPDGPEGTLVFGQPLLVQWLAGWLVPERASEFVAVSNAHLNPFLMAGWVGLLVTGLNMMPLGQLDGGHVAFGLLGRRSFWVAVFAMLASLGYMIYTQVAAFALMLLLVFFMGLRHPPSSDDEVTLGALRQVVGWLSLVLPLLCIPGNPVSMP
ncbi:MAG: site-2 protease family protein [Planctomycetota bacterium]|nr:MAG: site-2 protease family protein [Planctomycetota bacterium]